jgi:aspartate/methionine/tyrosine aminotransferase
MPEELSLNVAYLKPSETVAIAAETKRRRAAGEDIVDLSLGEPDFDTPRVIADAGVQAIQKGMTHYPPNIGIPELRAGIARNLSLLSGGRPNADQIVAVRASRPSSRLLLPVRPGDKVLIPAPAWSPTPDHFLCRASRCWFRATPSGASR